VGGSLSHVYYLDEDGGVHELAWQEQASPNLTSKHPRSPEKPIRQRQIGPAAELTQGQINAVRAAFNAGVTPSRIARQFGLSQSQVRKALSQGGG
jgi:hypothetical protein